MKAYFNKSVTTIEEVDIEFPFYSMVEQDESVIHVRITEHEFLKIEKQNWINIFSFSRHKRNNEEPIAEIWHTNPSEKQEFDDAFEFCKNLVNL